MNPAFDVTPWTTVFEQAGQPIPAQLLAALTAEDAGWLRAPPEEGTEEYGLYSEPMDLLEYGIVAEDNMSEEDLIKVFWIGGLPELAIYMDLRVEPPRYGTVMDGELEENGPDLADALWAILPDWHSKDGHRRAVARALVEDFQQRYPAPFRAP